MLLFTLLNLCAEPTASPTIICPECRAIETEEDMADEHEKYANKVREDADKEAAKHEGFSKMRRGNAEVRRRRHHEAQAKAKAKADSKAENTVHTSTPVVVNNTSSSNNVISNTNTNTATPAAVSATPDTSVPLTIQAGTKPAATVPAPIVPAAPVSKA